MSLMPRAAEVILPILRSALPGVTVTTWGADIDYRTFPFINIRRVGGTRNSREPNKLNKPVIEMSAYVSTDLPDCEQLYQSRWHSEKHCSRLP